MIHRGSWLGIDLGSARRKLCCFCGIESDGRGTVTVHFEQGPGREPYPSTNSKSSLLGESDPSTRRPTYFKDDIEAEVRATLDRSELVGRWLEQSADRPSAIGIDAPVAFAVDGRCRLTEKQSTDTFETPTRESFEAQLRVQSDLFLRINCFWKCVGLTTYCHLASRLEPRLADASLETIAALTCARDSEVGRLRETFPSDVYKRANGIAGRLSRDARKVLERLVDSEWQAAGRGPGLRPTPQTLNRLETIREAVRLELQTEPDGKLSEMRKRPGRAGDLWDAFACALTACCEDHDAAKFHGWSQDPDDQRRLRAEGAILTVTTRPVVSSSAA